MSELPYFVSLAFLIAVSKNTLFWVELWQRKEYRLDRISTHLLDTKQGKNVFFSWISHFRWILIFLYALVVYDLLTQPIYDIIVFLFFALQGGLATREIAQRRLKRPKFTFKATIITLLTLGVVVLASFITPMERFLWLLVLDRLVPFFVAIFVALFSIPTEMYTDIRIQQAIKKLKAQKKLLVIGITGSYGKTSTKEYIAKVLAKKFRVVRTKASNNTPIGVANTVLRDVKKDTQVLVVEMGAYKKGEIGELCQIVHPKIGVLTAVNEQHLALFGSLDKIVQTKYELILSLPKNGLGLFNANNDIVYDLFKKTEKKKVLYLSVVDKSLRDKTMDAAIHADAISTKKRGVTFSVFLRGERIQFVSKVIGAHNVENILPGIYIADFLGMDHKDIQEAVAKLLPLPKTMVPYSMQTGAMLVDDTYNVNPEGITAALEYMKIYSGKKIIVLEPMIELGKHAAKRHLQIGKEIGKVCDYLFLTNRNFLSSIKQGVSQGKKNCQIRVGALSEFITLINDQVEKDDVILFEGRETAMYFDKVINE